MTIVAIPAGYLFNKYISIKQESIQSLNKKI